MTKINVRTLADARDGSRVLDATITATATRARFDGPTITLPEPVEVRLRRGELSAPLVLDAPDGTWAWLFLVRPTGARLIDAIKLLRTFAGPEVDWEDMTPVDPATLAPLDPLPPSAAQVLMRAEAAIGEAEEAVDEATAALGVANTAVVSGAVAGDDLILTQKNGGVINAGNVRGLPGSIVPYGVNLAQSDLNTILTQGVYRQGTGGDATLERNYPVASTQGILEVLYLLNNGNLMQRWTSVANNATLKGVFLRRLIGGTWSSWQLIPYQRTDTAAGIAIYTWDPVSTAAGRDQLIYGDTGLRTINSELGVTSGNVYIRRRTYEVTISFVNAVFGTLAGTVDLPVFQSNFRPQINSNGTVYIGGLACRFVFISSGVIRIYGLTAGASVDGTLTFTTNVGWPTTLPGAANGGIPYA